MSFKTSIQEQAPYEYTLAFQPIEFAPVTILKAINFQWARAIEMITPCEQAIKDGQLKLITDTLFQNNGVFFYDIAQRIRQSTYIGIDWEEGIGLYLLNLRRMPKRENPEMFIQSLTQIIPPLMEPLAIIDYPDIATAQAYASLAIASREIHF